GRERGRRPAFLGIGVASPLGIPMTLLVEDVEAARQGQEELRPASLGAAASQLSAFGVVILRNVFDPQRIGGLLERARRHADYVAAKATAGLDDFDFDESYVFSTRNLACELTALDPLTAGRSDDFTATSLYAAVMTDFVRSLLVDILGPRAFWWVARVRVSVPGNEGKPHAKLPPPPDPPHPPPPFVLPTLGPPPSPRGVVPTFDFPGLHY